METLKDMNNYKYNLFVSFLSDSENPLRGLLFGLVLFGTVIIGVRCRIREFSIVVLGVCIGVEKNIDYSE